MKCVYTGWFIKQEELQKALQGKNFRSLARPVEHPHVTLAFRPRNPDLSLLGSAAVIRATGYGNDGINEGLLVEVNSAEKSLAEQLKKVPVCHITLSVAEGGKPVDTAKLQFEPVEPFEIKGIFGAFTDQGKITFTPEK